MCTASLSQNLSLRGNDHVFSRFSPSAEVRRFRLLSAKAKKSSTEVGSGGTPFSHKLTRPLIIVAGILRYSAANRLRHNAILFVVIAVGAGSCIL